jgi:hypothetical protein
MLDDGVLLRVQFHVDEEPKPGLSELLFLALPLAGAGVLDARLPVYQSHLQAPFTEESVAGVSGFHAFLSSVAGQNETVETSATIERIFYQSLIFSYLACAKRSEIVAISKK